MEQVIAKATAESPLFAFSLVPTGGTQRYWGKKIRTVLMIIECISPEILLVLLVRKRPW